MLIDYHRFRLFVPSLATCALAVLLTGCETTQGPTVGATQPAPQLGAGVREIQPAPESKSFGNKKDVFQGAEYDPGVATLPNGAKQITMRLGEVREVFRGSFAIGDGQYEKAFFIPREARSVVQLIVETKGMTRSYFLRAIGSGDTVAGAVERRWLNNAGDEPANLADEARIQAAIQAQPFLISVR